ncbi:opioid growth factor receptor-like isoform X2 [Dreissena polymorpha]|nr:opioid growth factor receptor-like isoform X2 [Dreissena polymorpha]
MSTSLKDLDEFCSDLIERINDLKENVYIDCVQRHKQTRERLVKIKETCDKEMLTVNKRKQLIETQVQLKHNRSLYIEAVRLKRDKKEISARIQQIREANHMIQYSFCPNDKLAQLLINIAKEIGWVQDKVDGSDEFAEDSSVDEACDFVAYIEFYPSEAAMERYDLTIKDDYLWEDNLKFYRNESASKPFPGSYVEDMLAWRGDYKKLETGYFYIQWLFPIPASSGLNNCAQELYAHEADEMQRDPIVVGKVLRSYEMMLDFYGMELVDVTSGKVRRCTKNWENRYAYLNRTFPNYIRIRRILICLGQLGYERFQVPLVRFIMAEAKVTEELHAVDSKIIRILIEAIKDEDDRLSMSTLLLDMEAFPELFDQYGLLKMKLIHN